MADVAREALLKGGLVTAHIPVSINFNHDRPEGMGKAKITRDPDNGRIFFEIEMPEEHGLQIVDLLEENIPMALAWALYPGHPKLPVGKVEDDASQQEAQES